MPCTIDVNLLTPEERGESTLTKDQVTTLIIERDAATAVACALHNQIKKRTTPLTYQEIISEAERESKAPVSTWIITHCDDDRKRISKLLDQLSEDDRNLLRDMLDE